MSEQTTTWPSRVVDRENQGWYLTQDAGRNLIYSAGYRHQDLPDRDGGELAATRGPIRPVLPITDADELRMRELFGEAGRKTVGTLAAALETVFHQLLESRGGLASARDSFEYAMRTIKAGREGSWESEALDNIVFFGNELNLPQVRGIKAWDVDARRATGPGKRVDRAVHYELAGMLYQWVTGLTGTPKSRKPSPRSCPGTPTTPPDGTGGAPWRISGCNPAAWPTGRSWPATGCCTPSASTSTRT